MPALKPATIGQNLLTDCGQNRPLTTSDVCYLASQLELKVIRMVMNEKYFPKRARFVISNKLVDLATDVSINYDAANDIFPNTIQKKS